MLSISNSNSDIGVFTATTKLTEVISLFNVLSKQDVVRFINQDLCVCLVFNYGGTVKVQLQDSNIRIGSNEFNITLLRAKDQQFSFSADGSEILVDIITLPIHIFQEIITYFSIDILESDFLFPVSKKISDEIRYNVQTIHLSNVPIEKACIYVHGKLITILGLQLLELGHVKKLNNRKLVVKKQTELYAEMNRVERMIRNDWTKPHTLKALSKLIGTNECYLKRDFKEVFGMSISAYRLKKKMEEANSLLLRSDQNIKSIAKKLGYKHTTHFTTAYKKFYEMTPGELRKQHVGNS